MNTSRAEAQALAEAVSAGVSSFTRSNVVLCVPYIWLADVATVLADAPGHLRIGAQDVAPEASGAFTGAISASMVAELASYTIIGHSERTHYFAESAEVTRKKLHEALAAGLNPILCVGEDTEAAGSEDAVATELQSLLQDIAPEHFDQVTVAYEPVWAIGTGKAATPEYAEPVLNAIRTVVGESVRILYGGSATADNATSFLQIANCDGLLVGGASLKADVFTTICAAAESVAG
jgi:triosephosphate isomerase